MRFSSMGHYGLDRHTGVIKRLCSKTFFNQTEGRKHAKETCVPSY